MKQETNRKPFFARLLEGQGRKPPNGEQPTTRKYPSDNDEEDTLKFPSDFEDVGGA
ncbi:microviridin/marinostatin family tricyclic proteinase inhibitor [Cystobacter ferrugineus]|uniref:microviridin/marinostatin family tricyclic proteinase inhibitor n=1 Tax=Cystobacter ferrugineus TaxID=83449 RepID=UPI000AC2B90A|nr:microviridin/marinostatin family tricyclic proteinase inhibitor [Cystobacter ferrugineus]